MGCDYLSCEEQETKHIIKIKEFEIKYCRKHYEFASSVYNTLILQVVDAIKYDRDLNTIELFEYTSESFKELVVKLLCDAEYCPTIKSERNDMPEFVEGVCDCNGCEHTDVAYCFSLGHIRFHFCKRHFKKHGEYMFKRLSGEISGSKDRVGVKSKDVINSFRQMINELDTHINDAELFIINIKKLVDEAIKINERGDYKCQKLM